jgi:hypothetical protein
MKLFITVLLLLSLSSLTAQTVVITVKDEQNSFVSDYSVYKNATSVGDSWNFLYVLTCLPSDTIQVKKEGRISEIFVVPSDQDTLFITLLLTTKVQEIEEVTATFEKYVKVAGGYNENLIDFYFYPKGKSLLLLKSYKGEYFIEKKESDLSQSHRLWFTPKALYMDVLGNTHVLSKDSSYQIHFGDSLTFVATIPIDLFENKIKALVAKTDDHLFYQNHTWHNKSYTLSKTNSDNQITVVTKVFDETAYKVASIDFNEIIKYYYESIPAEENVIENGIWNGKLESLAYDWKLTLMISWYIHTSSKPIECYSFGRMENILLVNLLEKEFQTIDFQGQIFDIKEFKIIDLKNPEVLYDYFYDALYLFGTQKGKRLLYKIDVEDGELIEVQQIDRLQPSHLKVVGNEAFFLSRNEAGFNKLYRMRLNSF